MMEVKGERKNVMIRRKIWAALLVFMTAGGAWAGEPEDIGSLSVAARDLADRALKDIPAGTLRDYHTHIVGMGTSGPGVWVNPKGLSWAHPVERLKTLVYLNASGVTDEARADNQYIERLTRLIRRSPSHGKHYILAFDYNHAPGCVRNEGKSAFYVDNDYVVKLAAANPDIFIPAVSVHPYRADAVDRLGYWAERGVRMVKWLPNSMGVNACDRRLKAYYCALKRNGMVLNTHTGEERAAAVGDGDQALGNPLLLRYPLDLGVKVIAAHSASLGTNQDLDKTGETTGNFQLFMRLMDDPLYKDNLFGDISATTQYNRVRFEDNRESGPLLELLRRPDLHGRLVNGSDYPLPAINWLVHLGKLEDMGLIGGAEADHLREIYNVNPLLFDLVLKRTVRDPDTGKGFPATMFTANPAFGDERTPDENAASFTPSPEPGRCPVDLLPTFGQVWALCSRGQSGPKHRDKCDADSTPTDRHD